MSVRVAAKDTACATVRSAAVSTTTNPLLLSDHEVAASITSLSSAIPATAGRKNTNGRSKVAKSSKTADPVPL